MAQPFIGEIRMFGGNFNPLGWEFCDGRLLPISENEALFTLIGTTYGGNGNDNFALPDLRGRVPMHQGNSHTIGEAAGVEAVTLTAQQIPVHTHPLVASTNLAQDTSPSNKVLGQIGGGAFPYIQDATDTNLSPQAATPAGGSQPHDNMQQYLAITYIIATVGIFPQQS